MRERVQKVLARAGLTSRRGGERLIAEGRVTVNGRVVDRPGLLVDPERDAIKVDGRLAPAAVPHAYFALNKPRGVLTTMSDPRGRPTISGLLGGIRTRVVPVGRLDYHSEGLLLLTNDGDLARALTHPSTGVPKTYLCKVRGEPDGAALGRLRRGIALDGRLARARAARIVKRAANAWVEVVVVEGRKHLVRRLLSATGHPVVKLRRVRFGPIALGPLAPGAVRRLARGEIDALRRAAAAGAPARRRADDLIH
jgi:pseudouridine synthase